MSKTGHQNESATRAGRPAARPPVSAPLPPARQPLRVLRRKPQPAFDCRYAAGFGGCDSSAEPGNNPAD